MITTAFALLALAGLPTGEIRVFHDGTLEHYTECSVFYQPGNQLNAFCGTFAISGDFHWTPSDIPINLDISVTGNPVVNRSDCWLVDEAFTVECNEIIFTGGFEL